MPGGTAPESPWFTVRQAATYINRHPRTVLYLLESGELKGHQRRPMGKWTIAREALDAWARGDNLEVQPPAPQQRVS